MNKTINDKKERRGTVVLAKVVCAVLALVMMLPMLVGCGDSNFDYLTSNLSNYVELSREDYFGYDLELSIAKPHDIDVDVALLNLISSEQYRKLGGDGAFVSGVPVTAGDKVVIRYRGYTVNDKGEEITVSTAMSNIQIDYSAYDYDGATIQIGDDNTSFLPVGFELGLIGKDPDDYAKFSKITTGKPESDMVVYVSFERLIEGGDAKKDTLKATRMRIDLADPEVDKVFGEGFLASLKSFEIGNVYNNIEVKINNKKYNYNQLTIDFATTCEKASTSENGKAPLVVEGYFPYDFGIDGTATAGLRDKTVYYQVFILQVQPYDTPELNDEFIKKVLAEKGSPITEAELNEKYKDKGAALVDKYKAYAKDVIDEAYEEAYDIMVEDEMWSYYLKTAKIKKHPDNKVTQIYNQYVDDVYFQYKTNNGALQDSEGNFKNYETVDEFALAYLSLSEGTDWKQTLRKMSEDLVKERLILYYIMREENIVPKEDVLAAKVKEIKDEYFEEYVKQFLEYQEKTKEDFTDAEYAEFLEERREEIFDYYDDDYFTETAYYELALEKMRTFPKVYTLNNPKPAQTK